LKSGVKFSFLDLFLFAVISGVAVWAFFRISLVLHYKWDWSGAFTYIARYDETSGSYVSGLLLEGLGMTVRLSIWSSLLASLIGLIAGIMKLSEKMFLKWIAIFYIGIVRNIPSIVFIFIFYFFISSQITLVLNLDEIFTGLEKYDRILSFLFSPSSMLTLFISAVLTLALYEGAYMAEIVRAGIESIEKGQVEAADALGFTWIGKMRYIVLPQAFKRILPPMAGQIISVIKDSAIVSVISVQELTFRGTELMASSYRTYEIWIMITAMYFIVTYGCAVAVRYIEKSMERRGYV